MQLPLNAQAIISTLPAHIERALLGFGLLELRLQLRQVFVGLVQAPVPLGEFLIEHLDHLGRLASGGECALGEIVAALADREFRLFLPLRLAGLEVGALSLRLLSIRNQPSASAAKTARRQL